MVSLELNNLVHTDITEMVWRKEIQTHLIILMKTLLAKKTGF